MTALPRLLRSAMALGFALVLASVPIRQVAACSCGSSEPGDAIRAAQLAFIGTVAGQRDTGIRSEFAGELREHAFAVSRSNEPTDAVTLILAGTDGISCGVVFGNGEEWLIIASRTPAGLETNLCSGNIRMTDIGAAEREAIVNLLPAESSAAPGTSEEPADLPAEPSAGPPAADERSPDAPDVMTPLAIGALAIVVLAGIGLAAFRRARA